MREAKILLVEDNEGDIVLTLDMFETAGLTNKISVVRDGEKALDYLYRRNQFSAVDRPDVILMDINIPKLNGKEVLSIVKGDEQLKDIPIMMLTTSSSQRDIEESFTNHANFFVTKPLKFDAFAKCVAETLVLKLTLVTITST